MLSRSHSIEILVSNEVWVTGDLEDFVHRGNCKTPGKRKRAEKEKKNGGGGENIRTQIKKTVSDK
ncbi:MAG: hypothetical protein GY820_20480 [Gammaproteobacteria bacterium]|nr:hypothetical protein [Gammaproteobacteria bacterium]